MSLNHELLDEAWKQIYGVRRLLKLIGDEQFAEAREDMLDSVNASLKILNRFTNYEDVEQDSHPAKEVIAEHTGKCEDKIILHKCD